MSWSAGGVVRTANLDEDLATIVIPYDHIAESDDQLVAAKEAVKALIASNGVGAVDYYNVSFSGHAVEGHVVSATSSEGVNAGVSQSTQAYYDQAVAAKKAAEESAS